VARDLLARQAAAPREQIVSVAGQEIVGLPQHDLQPVALELHVADHLRLKQAHRVARRRIAEARQELVGDGGAADRARSFEHRDLEALLRQIVGAGQAIVARADDDRVVCNWSTPTSLRGRNAAAAIQ